MFSVMPAGAREEVRDRGLAGVGDDLPGRRRDGRVRLRRFRRRRRDRPASACRSRRRSCDPPACAVSAYVRLATAWASSAASGQLGGHLGRDHAAHVAFERDPLHLRADQHAHACARRRLAERGARVVVREDRLVGCSRAGRSRARRPGSCPRRARRRRLRSPASMRRRGGRREAARDERGAQRRGEHERARRLAARARRW